MHLCKFGGGKKWISFLINNLLVLRKVCHILEICLTLLESLKLLLKLSAKSCIATSKVCVPVVPLPNQVLALSNIFYLINSSPSVVALNYASNLHLFFLMSNGVNIFSCAYLTSIYILMAYIFKCFVYFCEFFNIFLILCLERYWCILDTSYFSDIGFSNTLCRIWLALFF
jgi:hypothetical protein